jgi:hypothetical protein
MGRFFAVEHAFRLATEAGTRQGLKGPFFRDYMRAVGNLHGWADGDEFYVNYVGHPMQGAVAGFIWAQNDTKYRKVEFGRDRLYWKGKLRATAFAWAQSEQFEIGPVSEASIGNIQGLFPQQGFVDHVVTPVIGLGWMLAEDAIDKKIIKPLEGHTTTPWIRILLRNGLNPSRTFANLMANRRPWDRDTRAGVLAYRAEEFPDDQRKPLAASSPENPLLAGVAPFEFTTTLNTRAFAGTGATGSCVGGGASGAFRLAPAWQLVVDVNGCKLLGLDKNVTGDSLSYLIGPRWRPATGSRWGPYAQFLLGGNKLTQEQMYPARKAALEEIARQENLEPPAHEDYTRQEETNGFSISAGAGCDLRINDALAIRLVSLDISRSWVGTVGGINYSKGLGITTGLVLRMGTW